MMRKQRRTKEEMDTLRGAIYAVAEADRPVSVRHIFYRMVTQDLVEKSDRGYQQLQKVTVDMRDGGTLPYPWIEDSSRRAYMNTGYAGVGSFAEVAASIYRATIGTLRTPSLKSGASPDPWPESWARYAASTWFPGLPVRRQRLQAEEGLDQGRVARAAKSCCATTTSGVCPTG